jgi:hypothetical protein
MTKSNLVSSFSCFSIDQVPVLSYTDLGLDKRQNAVLVDPAKLKQFAPMSKLKESFNSTFSLYEKATSKSDPHSAGYKEQRGDANMGMQ